MSDIVAFSINSDNSQLMDEISVDDMIALGIATEAQVNLYRDRSGETIDATLPRDNNNNIEVAFHSFYEKTVYTEITQNLSYLNYFEPLNRSGDLDKKNIYNSLVKVFSSALEIQKAIQEIGVLHQNAINEINKINHKTVLARELFKSIRTDFSSLNDSNVKCLHAIDTRLIENCQIIINSMKEKQETLNSLFDYKTEDMQNLGKILGSEISVVNLANKTSDLEKLLEDLEQAQKQLFLANKKKFMVEKQLSLISTQLDDTKDVLKRLQDKRVIIEGEVQVLEKNKSNNLVNKMEILKTSTDTITQKSSEFQNECLKMRQDFQTKLVQSINDIDNEQKKLLRDVTNITQVSRNLNLIFLIDESGSMCASDCSGKKRYDAVIECVKNCVSSRALARAANDKFSIVKFNDEAVIEILYKNVGEKFEISGMRGGGTTFVKPLVKLMEILNENDFDLLVPVVLFLSDGQGESKQKVLQQCNVLADEFKNDEMLFFAVGFGTDADSQTLKEMSQILNHGKSILSIGMEKFQVYYHANNQEDLVKAFTIYEKLFNYQTRVLETKRNMLSNHLAEQEKIYEKNIQVIEKITKKTLEGLNATQLQSEELAGNLGKINEKFDKRILICRSLVEELVKEENEIRIKITNQETLKSKLEGDKKLTEDNYIEFSNDYQFKREKYENLRKTIDEKNMEMIEAYKNETDFKEVLKKLENLGIKFEENQKIDFKINYLSFFHNFNLFIQKARMLKEKSNEITLYFDFIVHACEVFGTNQSSALEIVTTESLETKLWKLFRNYFAKKIPSLADVCDEDEDEDVFKRIVLSSMSKNDRNNPNVNGAFKIILGHMPVRALFQKIVKTKKKNYLDEMFEEIKDQLQEEIDNMNVEIDELKNEDSKGNLDLIKDQKKEIEQKKREKLDLGRHKIMINRILRTLEQMVNEMREKYMDSKLCIVLESSYSFCIEKLDPHVNILRKGFNSKSNNPKLSSNFSRLAIRN